MTRQIIFAPLARLEFEDAVAWYDDQRPGLGDEFRIEVHEMLQVVLKFPDRFRLAFPGTRKAKLPNHPYSIYYSIERDSINIISVFHGSRNPFDLGRRLK
jgi:plasmid stabilization system protein ParE